MLYMYRVGGFVSNGSFLKFYWKFVLEKKNPQILLERALHRKTCQRHARVSGTATAEQVNTICISIFLIHVYVFRMGWFFYALMPKCYWETSDVGQHKWVFCTLQQRVMVSVFSCYPQAVLVYSSSGISTWHTLQRWVRTCCCIPFLMSLD